MIADIVKSTREEILAEQQRRADRWNLTIFELECVEAISDNEADFQAILETAEALGVGPCDIDEGDVETYLDMGREAKGELESSVGLIQWLYDNKLKAYLILMILNDRPIMYKVSPEIMKDWKNSQSMGEYYNLYIRGNSDIEDPEHSCGCGPNPCEQGQVDQYKAKYLSIS